MNEDYVWEYEGKCILVKDMDNEALNLTIALLESRLEEWERILELMQQQKNDFWDGMTLARQTSFTAEVAHIEEQVLIAANWLDIFVEEDARRSYADWLEDTQDARNARSNVVSFNHYRLTGDVRYV